MFKMNSFFISVVYYVHNTKKIKQELRRFFQLNNCRKNVSLHFDSSSVKYCKKENIRIELL